MDTKRIALSKSILEMKVGWKKIVEGRASLHDNIWACLQFMKRTKDKVEKEQFQEEGEEYFGSKLTSRMKKTSYVFYFLQVSKLYLDQ